MSSVNLLQDVFCHDAVAEKLLKVLFIFFKVVCWENFWCPFFYLREKPVEKPGRRLTLLLVVSCFSGDPVRQPCLQHKVLSVSDAARQGGVSSGEAGAGGPDQRWDQVPDLCVRHRRLPVSDVVYVWCNVLLCCSEAYGLREFYQQTQERLQARRDALQSSSHPDRPVVDGDVTTMTVKFERSVFTL